MALTVSHFGAPHPWQRAGLLPVLVRPLCIPTISSSWTSVDCCVVCDVDWD